jgi:hypothetical protein
VAFGGLLVSGLILAPAAHADACDNLTSQTAVQLCKIHEKTDPNIGDQQRQDSPQIAQNEPPMPVVPGNGPILGFPYQTQPDPPPKQWTPGPPGSPPDPWGSGA